MSVLEKRGFFALHLLNLQVCGLSDKFQQQLTVMLENVLPQYPLQYDALSNFSTVWGRFLDLISARLKALHNTREAARLKACDNFDIVRNMTGPRGTIASIADLTHRFGSVLTRIILGARSEFSVRERCFLLLMVMHDFHRATFKYNGDTIETKQAEFTACNPGAPFITVFDYTAGSAVEIRIEDVGQDASKYFHGEYLEQWSDHVSRAGQSGGRMGLFVMAVPAGTQTRYFDIPHRGETLDSYLGADHKDFKLVSRETVEQALKKLDDICAEYGFPGRQCRVAE
ncbi:hypothetical protein B0H13DRAFT_1899339 [Mycena leptocephala]|nr:hypothetical protein B0H13DRAFT_1899339 [Mycena leptocephala]